MAIAKSIPLKGLLSDFVSFCDIMIALLREAEEEHKPE